MKCLRVTISFEKNICVNNLRCYYGQSRHWKPNIKHAQHFVSYFLWLHFMKYLIIVIWNSKKIEHLRNIFLNAAILDVFLFEASQNISCIYLFILWGYVKNAFSSEYFVIFKKYIFHKHKIVVRRRIAIWGLRSARIKKLKKTDPHFFKWESVFYNFLIWALLKPQIAIRWRANISRIIFSWFRPLKIE